MKSQNIHIGEQRKAFAPFLRNVVIRHKNGKSHVIASLGYDSRGNDILCVIHIDDILPKQL